MLVVNQLIGKYDCNNDILRVYHEECLELLKEFKMVSIEHVPKIKNEEANRPAQSASGYRPICVAAALELPTGDWRREIIEYLKNPLQKVSRQLRYKASKFVSLEGDLYYRTIDGVFLKCLGVEESKVLMGEIHEGICGEHQLAYKMKWIIRRNGFFCPTILEDSFEYYKGCQDCEKFGNIQRAPASAMKTVIKLWPFRAWGIDLIGQIYPLSSMGHKFVLVATDYFTKWVEAIPLKIVTS